MPDNIVQLVPEKELANDIRRIVAELNKLVQQAKLQKMEVEILGVADRKATGLTAQIKKVL